MIDVRARSGWVRALGSLVLLALVAACGGSGDDDGAGSSGGEGPADAGGTIRVGVLTALSGAYVSFGEPLRDGVELAIDEINGDGGLEINGVTYEVEMVTLDTRSDVNVAVAGATELVRDEGVQFIIGPATGIETAAAREITQPDGVIEISAASNLAGVLTEENTQPGADLSHLFMFQASGEVREPLTVRAVEQYLDAPQRHALIIGNDANGEFIGESVVAAIENAGGEMALDVVYYEPGTTDYSSYLTRIREARPDVLHIWWNPSDGVNILEQAKQMDTAGGYFVFGLEPADVEERLGGAADGVVIACSPVCRSETTTDATEAFWESYEEYIGAQREFGAAAGSAAWYYDATRMLLEAMVEAGTVDDTDAIAETLAGLSHEGVLGDLSFDDRHVIVHGFDVCAFEAGVPTCEYLEP